LADKLEESWNLPKRQEKALIQDSLEEEEEQRSDCGFSSTMR